MQSPGTRSYYVHVGAQRRQFHPGLHLLHLITVKISTKLYVLVDPERVNQLALYSFPLPLTIVLAAKSFFYFLLNSVINILSKLLSSRQLLVGRQIFVMLVATPNYFIVAYYFKLLLVFARYIACVHYYLPTQPIFWILSGGEVTDTLITPKFLDFSLHREGYSNFLF